MSYGREMDDGSLVFPQRGDPPPEQVGYQRSSGNPFVLEPIWVPCQFRSTGFTPCDCPGQTYRKFKACQLGLKVSAKICRDCKSRVEGESIQDYRLLRELWQEMHTLEHATGGWWSQFLSKLPQFEAESRSYAEQNPIPFRDPEKFFIWGVNFHNFVNAKLKKPIMDLEVAKGMYLK